MIMTKLYSRKLLNGSVSMTTEVLWFFLLSKKKYIFSHYLINTLNQTKLLSVMFWLDHILHGSICRFYINIFFMARPRMIKFKLLCPYLILMKIK